MQANTCTDMMVRRDVFQAIADPTRREIVNLLAQQPQNLNAISTNFKVSRQAISLHIKILEECGLVEVSQQGNNRICKAKLEKLSEVDEWVSHYRTFWSKKFTSLKKLIDHENKIKKNNHEKGTGRANRARQSH